MIIFVRPHDNWRGMSLKINFAIVINYLGSLLKNDK